MHRNSFFTKKLKFFDKRAETRFFRCVFSWKISFLETRYNGIFLMRFFSIKGHFKFRDVLKRITEFIWIEQGRDSVK